MRLEILGEAIPKEQGKQKEDEEDTKQNFGDACGGTSETTEAKKGCDQSDDEKNNSVVKHGDLEGS